MIVLSRNSNEDSGKQCKNIFAFSFLRFFHAFFIVFFVVFLHFCFVPFFCSVSFGFVIVPFLLLCPRCFSLFMKFDISVSETISVKCQNVLCRDQKWHSNWSKMILGEVTIARGFVGWNSLLGWNGIKLALTTSPNGFLCENLLVSLVNRYSHTRTVA